MSQFFAEQPNAQQGQWIVSDAESGESLITFTSFLDMDMKAESKVPTQPTEEGGFFTYNKVETPDDVRVSLAVQGQPDVIEAAISALREAKNSTQLLAIETPDEVLDSFTLAGFNYRRTTQEGAGLLVVELMLTEVRQVAAQYADVKLPARQCKNKSDASRQDSGKQQAEKPRSSVASQTKNKLAGFLGGGANNA